MFGIFFWSSASYNRGKVCVLIVWYFGYITIMENNIIIQSEIRVVHVWEFHMDNFKGKIEKIRRRIERKGIPAFLNYNILKTENVCIDERTQQFSIRHTINLEFPKIVLPGEWEVIGEITEGEKTEKGIFNFVNGYGNLQKYVSWDLCDCEHCHTRRARTHSIILRSKLDNSEKVVGSSCVRDFMGIDPESAIFLLQFIESFEQFGRNNAEDLKSNLYGINSFIPAIIHSLKTTGWRFISAKYARENDCSSTAGIASAIFFDWKNRVRQFPEYPEVVNSQFYISTTKELIASLESLSESLSYDMPEFEQKIAILARKELIDMTSSFQINILTAWAMRHILNKVSPIAKEESNHFGVIGEKVSINVIPMKCYLSEGQYGTTYIISGIVEGTGDKWTWFGTGKAVERLIDKNNLAIQEVFTISATIKNHENNKYGKATILTRLKVI